MHIPTILTAIEILTTVAIVAVAAALLEYRQKRRARRAVDELAAKLEAGIEVVHRHSEARGCVVGFAVGRRERG